MPKNSILIGTNWYHLFSRGARDWLRHNEKIREITKNTIPDLIAESNLITNFENKSIQIPVKVLEHARFRLNSPTDKEILNIGQGICQPGDEIIKKSDFEGDAENQPANLEGNISLQIELNLEDFLDFIGTEMNLPDIQVKNKHTTMDNDLNREGWNKTGIHSNLDRRRTLKEFLKRKPILYGGITNNDLRFRQLVQRRNPVTSAVVFFILDVSASMNTEERRLAKSFFFFAMQGIRKKYTKIEMRFIAHTTQAWEFCEKDFFQVTGAGGTGASSGFKLTSEIIENEYDNFNYNRYAFYASDGENFTEDRLAAKSYLKILTQKLNYTGYIETVPGTPRNNKTEMSSIFTQLLDEGLHVGNFIVNKQADIWDAIKHFFKNESTSNEIKND